MLTIYFDMDGTIADLYSVPHWKDCLRRESTAPYYKAMPLENMTALCEKISEMEKQYKIRFAIISWGSMGASEKYLHQIERVKRNWCKRYLPIVQDIVIMPYGMKKSKGIKHRTQYAILIDDSLTVCADWCTPKQRFYYLKESKITVLQILDIIEKRLEKGDFGKLKK